MLHRDSCNDHDDNQDDLAFFDDKETMSLDKYVTDTSEYPKRIPGRRLISLGLQNQDFGYMYLWILLSKNYSIVLNDLKFLTY